MSNAIEPVGVFILVKTKVGKETIRSESNENTEAIIKQFPPKTYILEVRERGSSDDPWEFNFSKIESYKMKTITWHEVKYKDENTTFTLRFKGNDKNFPPFLAQLQCVLQMHKMPTKPKYTDDFMKEVQSFKAERLTPLSKSKKGPRQQFDSGISGDSEYGDDNSPLPSGFSIRQESRESFPNRRNKPDTSLLDSVPEENPNSPRDSFFPKSPAPNYNRTTTPRNGRSQRPSDSNTSDEDYSTGSSSNDHAPRHNTIGKFSDTSFVQSSDRRQRTNVRNNNRDRPNPSEGKTPPPPPPPRQNNTEYVNSFPAEQFPNRKKEPSFPTTPAPPIPPKKPNNPPVKPLPATPAKGPGPHGSDRNAGNSPGAQGQQEARYGTAPPFSCKKCTYMNKWNTMACEMCFTSRGDDVWQCPTCKTTYSTDLNRCHTCPTWRCRLCTYVNDGHPDAMVTRCDACLQ